MRQAYCPPPVINRRCGSLLECKNLGCARMAATDGRKPGPIYEEPSPMHHAEVKPIHHIIDSHPPIFMLQWIHGGVKTVTTHHGEEAHMIAAQMSMVYDSTIDVFEDNKHVARYYKGDGVSL